MVSKTSFGSGFFDTVAVTSGNTAATVADAGGSDGVGTRGAADGRGGD